MRGFITVRQWYSLCKTIDELVDEEQHTGDAAAIDLVLGFTPPEIVPEDPGTPSIGSVVMRVEDDGKLTLVHANFDSSD